MPQWEIGLLFLFAFAMEFQFGRWLGKRIGTRFKSHAPLTQDGMLHFGILVCIALPILFVQLAWYRLGQPKEYPSWFFALGFYPGIAGVTGFLVGMVQANAIQFGGGFATPESQD